jgi:hypothetical protein
MAEVQLDRSIPHVDPWRPPDPGRWGVPRIVGVTVVAAAALVITVVRFVAEGHYQSGVERLLQAMAFGLLLGSPALLAALSPHRRAILLAPAAFLLTPLAFLSFAGVLLPLLVPGVLFWWALVTRWDHLPCGLLRGAASILVVVSLVSAGGAALFVHADPRSYETESGGRSTSDVVTSAEALISLGLVSVAVVAGWLLAAPRRSARRVDVGSPGTT